MTMVEKVALALVESFSRSPMSRGGYISDAEIEACLPELARAAIAAMREPTDAVIAAVNRAAFAQGGGAIVLAPVFKAYFDAALTEEP